MATSLVRLRATAVAAGGVRAAAGSGSGLLRGGSRSAPAASRAAAAATTTATLPPVPAALGAARFQSSSAVVENGGGRRSGGSSSSSNNNNNNNNADVLMPSEVDLKKMLFREPVHNSYGGQHVFVALQNANGTGTQPVRIQTPWVTLPFGMSQYGPDSPWQLMCALAPGETPEAQAEMAEFAEFMERFDARVVEEGVQNAKEWWPGKTMIPEIVGYNYRSPLKPSADESQYPPNLKTRVVRNRDTDEFNLDVFQDGNTDHKLPAQQALTRGTSAKLILMCTGLWFVHGNWGVTWRALQVLVRDNPSHEERGERAELDGPAFRG